MNNKTKYNREKLPGTLRFALFCTSYIPLFILIVIKQLFENIEYLHFGGLIFLHYHYFLENIWLPLYLLL